MSRIRQTKAVAGISFVLLRMLTISASIRHQVCMASSYKELEDIHKHFLDLFDSQILNNDVAITV